MTHRVLSDDLVSLIFSSTCAFHSEVFQFDRTDSRTMEGDTFKTCGRNLRVESVFAINGAGRLAWESILRSDLPVIQALVLCFSLIYIVLTFLADVMNAWLDPRMRMS